MIKEGSKNNQDPALALAIALTKAIETSSEKCNAKEQGESVRHHSILLGTYSNDPQATRP